MNKVATKLGWGVRSLISGNVYQAIVHPQVIAVPGKNANDLATLEDGWRVVLFCEKNGKTLCETEGLLKDDTAYACLRRTETMIWDRPDAWTYITGI